MLLDTDRMGRTAWHLAGENGNVQVLHKLWDWAEKKLTNRGDKNKIYYPQRLREGPRALGSILGQICGITYNVVLD